MEHSTGPISAKLSQGKLKEYLLVAVLLGATYGLLLAFLPVAVDWHHTYWPAARFWRDPYTATDGSFHNPPWALIFLYPFGLVPEAIGWAAFVLISLGLLVDVARVLGASKAGTIVALFAPPALSTLANGQIDILVLWGLALGIRARQRRNPWLLSLGLLLVSIKPQVAGIAGLLLWLESRDKLRPLVLLLSAIVLSVVIYGWWPAKWSPVGLDVSWNISIWPWGVPVGVILAIVAYRHRSEILAFLATPLVVPYLATHSLVGLSTAIASTMSMKSSVTVISIWWVLTVISKGHLLL